MPGAEWLELLLGTCRIATSTWCAMWAGTPTAPEAPERGPPGQAPEWPANALIPLNRSMRALISIRWFLLSLLLEVALRGILWALHSGDRARRLRCWWLVSH